MEKQKALVDAGLNIPFIFVTLDSSLVLRRFYYWLKYWQCGLGGVCVRVVINSQGLVQNFFI